MTSAWPRRSFLTGALAAVSSTTLGCHTEDTAGPDTVDALLDKWVDAVQRGDRAAHDEVWALEQPTVATRLADSLLGMSLTSFTATRIGETKPYPVDIGWQLPDDDPIGQQLRLAAAISGGVTGLRLAGIPTGQAWPLWARERVTTVRGDACGLLVGGPPGKAADQWAGRAVDRWIELLADAVHRAADRTGSSAPRVWLQLPSTTQQALAVLGFTPEQLGTSAAVTVRIGGEATHIVGDPTRLGALNDAEAAALLAHETTHVLTRAPHTSLPMWVEEGYAEAVAWADDEAGGWIQAAPLLDRIATDISSRTGAIAVPTDADFADRRDEPYARAWTLCRWMLEQQGWTGLRRWYHLQASHSEAQACAQVYGIDPPERLQRWRSWLVERVGR